MLFLDGVGLGERNTERNPFFKYGFKTFTDLFGAIPSVDNPRLQSGNKRIFPVDAQLGIAGLPLSGTGQASIFCGVNAAEIAGTHFGPFPHSTSVPIIKKQSIFQWCRERRKKAFFANAYPKIFFDYLKTGRSRISVTTLSYTSAGYKLNTSTDVWRGKAVTAEITNRRWNEKLGYRLPVIQPETAARRVLRTAAAHSFTLYEYFLTDHLGHGRIINEFQEIHHTLDRFLHTILSSHPDTMNVLIISDHGNYEDCGIKTHTLNPVLCLASGRYSARAEEMIRSLPDVKSYLVSLLQ
jgi:hypothetical protein